MDDTKEKVKILTVVDDDHVVVERDTGDHKCAQLLVRHKEGQPINTEMIRLGGTDDPNVYEVTDSFDPRDHDGPVRVSTPAFRSGWDRVFGKEGDLAN